MRNEPGEGIGGLLNATFGNAAELIIALVALPGGLHDVVKASLADSIVATSLLVLGAAVLAGGLGRVEQHYNPVGARSQATMLTLAAIALVVPAAYRAIAREISGPAVSSIGVWMSLVLRGVYAANLIFPSSHSARCSLDETGNLHDHHSAHWSVRRALLVSVGRPR